MCAVMHMKAVCACVYIKCLFVLVKCVILESGGGGKKSAIFIFSHDRPVLSEIQQFSCRTLNNATLHLKVHIAATK